MRPFTLPDLGEGLREAQIVSWHAGVGDHVVADQPLVSVETDKAVVEVPSPWSGRLARLHGKGGYPVAVGTPLAGADTYAHGYACRRPACFAPSPGARAERRRRRGRNLVL